MNMFVVGREREDVCTSESDGEGVLAPLRCGATYHTTERERRRDR